MACFISLNGLIFLSRVGATRSLARRGLLVSTRRMYEDSRRLRGPVGSRPVGDCLQVSDQLIVASKKLTWITGRQLWSCKMTGSAGGVNHSMLRGLPSPTGVSVLTIPGVYLSYSIPDRLPLSARGPLNCGQTGLFVSKSMMFFW
uniref:RxLR effector candidate protein n=1 Tax=Hyaloperonospora arabidopsidis (strain Emoy2) TaxID=559515 RepID=A0A090C2Q9_HYAAE|nr:RxLR effector candidate protein [Hyaloperonospora arabidopsidis Emoy2]